jgi:hypothetical protein
MKKFFAFILLLAFATQTFSQGITLLNFYMNRSYIAANQCENRFRPMLHCNGQCVLAKKLKQQEKSERQNPEKKLQGKEEVVSSRSFFTSSIVSPASFFTNPSFLADAATVDQPSSVFRPPCC